MTKNITKTKTETIVFRVIVIAFVILSVAWMANIWPFAATLPQNSRDSGRLSDLRRVPQGERLPRFFDEERLLEPAQAEELAARLDEISGRHQFDTVVAVVHSLGSRESRLYAADFFEQNGFGLDGKLDGAILLLATEDRDFGFAATGFGLKVFTPAGQNYLISLFLPHLSLGDYFEAFMAYADAADDFLAKAKDGEPYNKKNIPIAYSDESDEIFYVRLILWVIFLPLALIIAIIATEAERSKLRTIRTENLASSYVRKGSMVLTESRDIFLYRYVVSSKRSKPKKRNSDGDTFKSSSGRTWTGSSGKY